MKIGSIVPLLSAACASAGVLGEYNADTGNPPDAAGIQSPTAQGWTGSGAGAGTTVEGVVDGGTNAWRVNDDASGSNPIYFSALPAGDLQEMYLNGWEFEMVVRGVRGSGFCGWGVSVANDPGWGLTGRERVGFSIEHVAGNDAFQVSPTHGGTVTLGAGTGSAFHTIRAVGVPLSSSYEFFLDGASQGVFDIKDGVSNTNYDEVVRWGSGSTGGTGRETHWNLVRLTAFEGAIVTTVSDGSTEVDEDGATADSYTLALSQLPSADVTVTVTPGGPAEAEDVDLGAGPGQPLQLVFTPADWDTPQIVTVNAVDDLFEESTQQMVLSNAAVSTDGFYDGEQRAVAVTILDDDLVQPAINHHADVFVSPRGSFVTDPGLLHTFRIPSLLVAPDGSLLAFAEGRRGTGSDPRRQDNAPIDLTMKRSVDNGVTWGPLVTIDPGHQPNGWKVDFGDPTTLVDDTTDPATIVLFYGQWPDFGAIHPVPGNNPDPAAGNQVVWTRTSIDNGLTWSARSQVMYPDGPGDTPDGLYWRYLNPGPGNGIQLQWQDASPALNGRLVIPAKRSGSSTPAGSVTVEPIAFYSDDHGATWQVGNSTAGPDANESEVVELAGGEVLHDARQNGGSNRRRHLSTDGGVNWGPNLGDDVPITAVDCSLDRYSAVREGGDRNRILFSGPSGNPVGSGSGRQNITVWTSYDEGRSFINPVLVEPGGAAYSVVRTLPDGTMAVFAETDGDGSLYDKIEYYNFGLEFLEGMTHAAELTHYEGFGNEVDELRGGMGWSGPWSAGGTIIRDYADAFGSASVKLDGYRRRSRFGRLDLGGQRIERDLATPIDLGVDGSTYVSLLVSRKLDVSANGNTGEALRVEFLDGAGTAEATFGVTVLEAFYAGGLGAVQTSGSGALDTSDSYLLVAKIAAAAGGGADQLLLKAFPGGDFYPGRDESPVDWTVAGELTESNNTILERMALEAGAEALWSVDEIRIGTTWSAVTRDDTDGDSLDDGWELERFGDLTTSDGTNDPDGDGMTDAAEQKAGTDPLDPTSRLRGWIDEASPSLRWTSASGRRYEVEKSTTLETGSWAVVQAGLIATPPVNSWSFIIDAERAFFRVAVE